MSGANLRNVRALRSGEGMLRVPFGPHADGRALALPVVVRLVADLLHRAAIAELPRRAENLHGAGAPGARGFTVIRAARMVHTRGPGPPILGPMN